MIRPFFIWICLSLTWYPITHAAIDYAHFADRVFTSPTEKPETLTTPLGRVTTTTYDDRLLVDSIEEPSGQTTTFSYYDDGLLQQTVDPTGTIAYAFAAKGRLATVTEGTDVITRSYEELDRIQSFTDSQGQPIGYEFDGGGNLTTLIYPNSKGDVTYVKRLVVGLLLEDHEWK